MSNKKLISNSPAIIQYNIKWDLSSGYKSEKIKAKLLLWWCEDKSWCLLLSLCFQVWVLGFGLFQVLLCGCCLSFSFSFPVENTLLGRIWHNFDLSWCNLCLDWRNLSMNSTSTTLTNSFIRQTFLHISNFYNQSRPTMYSPFWMSLCCLFFSSSIFFL